MGKVRFRQMIVRDVAYLGRIQAPITFQSPQIDMRNGLDIGTLRSGEERSFHVVVRTRNSSGRDIDILDVEPDALEASLKPLSVEGSYRLTLTVPTDCPMVVFNVAQQHGYVRVGDPDDDRFSGGFPVYGAVVDLED